MEHSNDFLRQLAQWDFSEMTCGAEFEMIALDNENDVPLNRTMMSITDSFEIDDEKLPVWYGKKGKYYNTVWLINYTLRAHAAELKSSFHVQFEVPEAVSEDESFLELDIFNLSHKKIWSILPDGLSYMPEIVTAAGNTQEVQGRSTLIRSLVEYAVKKLWWRIWERQLPYVLGNYDMIESIVGISAKKNYYYATVIWNLWYRWKKIADLDDAGIKDFRAEYVEDLECPIGLLLIKSTVWEQTLKKRWFSHNAATTSHHLHISGTSFTETVDTFVALMWYEGKMRYEYDTAYFEQLGKWFLRHITFGSLIGLRYRISQKSRKFLEIKWISKFDEPLSDEIMEELNEKFLFAPSLRVSTTLSNWRDPEWSLACKVYSLIRQVEKWELELEEAQSKILWEIAHKFFKDPKEFIDAYQENRNGIHQEVQKSHSDIVLKTPAKNEDGSSIVTIELRWQDYPPLRDIPRKQTREAHVIENNLLFVQKSCQQYLGKLRQLKK